MKELFLFFSLLFYSNNLLFAQEKDLTVYILNNNSSYTCSEVYDTQQKDSSYINYWINIGALSHNEDLSAHYSFNFAFEKLSFSAMLFITGRFFEPNSDGYSTKSITTSIGYDLTKRYYLFAFYLGPGIIWGENHGYPNWYSFNNFCFNVNIQAYFLPLKNWGLGLEYITNLNEEHTLNRLHLSISYIIN